MSGTGTVLRSVVAPSILALACLASAPAWAAAPTASASPPADSISRIAPDTTGLTVFVARHAERNSAMVGDQPLSAAGFLRAQTLARLLRDAGIQAIYVTPYQRNRQTAQPLATALGESLIVIDAIDETVRRVRGDHWGQAVLVVGHSNTVPQIVKSLSGLTVPPFGEGEFDRLYVVDIRRDRPASVRLLRYGEPTGTQ